MSPPCNLVVVVKHLSNRTRKKGIPRSVPWSKPDIGSNERRAIGRVLRSGWLSQGKVTEDFEKELARTSNARYAVVVNSGSSALLCALLAHGALQGDRVLVPDYTHVATANVPALVGCKVFPVDADLRTLNVSESEIRRLVRKVRPKFVICVDVAGMPNDLDLLSELADEFGFILIEDGAEALGAEYKGRKVGSVANTATLSFHAAKLITTIEGGAVLTNDTHIAEQCRLIRNYGEAPDRKDAYTTVGTNLKITDVQSAIGIAQLRKLNKYVFRRNMIAERYREALSKWLEFQEIPEYVTRHPYMMFVTLANSARTRNMLRQYLLRNGIDTRTHFPPLHTQPKYRSVCSGFPNSTYIFRHALAPPIYNTMSDHEVDFVVSTVSNFFRR